MKRIISIVMAVLMVCALSTTAYAANITESGSTSANMTVEYGVDTSYTVTIPETVHITNARSAEATISISDALIPSGKQLDVSLTGDSYSDSTWHLTDVENSANQLRYSITDAESGAALASSDIVTSLPAGNPTMETNLSFTLLDEATYAGEYSDTITFTVGLVDEPLNASPVLAENPWTTIQRVVRAGRATEAGWQVGDISPEITYNGQKYTARLIGLNQDGENTATFMFTEGIAARGMNPRDREKYENTGVVDGYTSSEMSTWLNETVYNELDENTKSAIKTVNKLCSWRITGNNMGSIGWDFTCGVTEAPNKLFLLAVNEIGIGEDEIDPYCRDLEILREESNFVYTFFQEDTINKLFEAFPNSEHNHYVYYLRSIHYDSWDTQSFFYSIGMNPYIELPPDYGVQYHPISLYEIYVSEDLKVIPAFVVG